jgi:putative tricarboxylic transport membrane protein
VVEPDVSMIAEDRKKDQEKAGSTFFKRRLGTLKIREYPEYQVLMVSGVIAIVFALILYFVIIPSTIADITDFGVSSRFLPEILAGVIGFLGIWLVVEGFVKKKGYIGDGKYIINLHDTRLILITIGIIALYIIALEYVGYIVTTCLLIGTLMWLYGERRIALVAAIAILFPIVIRIFFAYALKMQLP